MNNSPKKRFFEISNQQNIISNSPKVNTNKIAELGNTFIDDQETHLLVKSELITVFMLVLSITLIFSTIWYTNTQNNWINSVSNSILSRLVSGY